MQNMLSQSDNKTIQKVDRISNLIVAHLRGTITTEQTKELMQWVNDSAYNKQCFEKWNDPESMREMLKQARSVDSERIWKKTINKIKSL